MLDSKTLTTLRIAFTIYGQGRNGSYWLHKADEQLQSQPITDDQWREVVALLQAEFSGSFDKYPRLLEWANGVSPR